MGSIVLRRISPVALTLPHTKHNSRHREQAHQLSRTDLALVVGVNAIEGSLQVPLPVADVVLELHSIHQACIASLRWCL